MNINELWSMDFVPYQLSTGRRFRILNVVDEYSSEVEGQDQYPLGKEIQ